MPVPPATDRTPLWTHDAALNAVLVREKARQDRLAEVVRRARELRGRR